MRFLIDIAMIISLLFGGKFITSKVYFEIKKATLSKIVKGLDPLTPFTEKLTGKKINY